MTNSDGSKSQQRRELLKWAALAGGAASLPAASSLSADTQQPVAGAAKNRIVAENERPGTADWQLTRVRIDRPPYRTALIEGYCSQQSYAAGERLRVFVSTSPARPFRLEIFRLGYYGGLGARKLQEFGPVDGITQPVPEMTAAPERLRECEWTPSVEFTIPEDWVSGVYLGRLTTVPAAVNEPYWQSYVIFIVRDDRPAEMLFQCSDNTWQAYNRWPVNESLYTHPDGAHAPGVAVSFDRPYGKYCQIFDAPQSIGSGEFLLWEYPLCYWLEQHGYDVTYGSNADTIDAAFITRCRTMISVGHDEYWDVRQYRATETAIEQGVNLLWLCGNSVFVVSPFSANGSGQPLRRITRTGCFGPLRQDETDAYANLFAGLQGTAPDERKIMGVRSVVPFNGGGDWTCVKPEHWLFDKTGMQAGESIPGLVGWEHHGEPDPERAGLEVLAAGKIWAGGVTPGDYAAVVFPGPKENFVFNASTIFWSQGLSHPPGHMLPWSHWSRPHGPDPRVQQMMHNLLRRAGSQPGT
jgi:hypothetical protein